MKDQEHIDDFVKRKLEETQFPFEEAYWKEAEKVLDADLARRWWRRFWLFSIPVVILSLVGLLYMWNSAEVPEKAMSDRSFSPVIVRKKENDHPITARGSSPREDDRYGKNADKRSAETGTDADQATDASVHQKPVEGKPPLRPLINDAQPIGRPVKDQDEKIALKSEAAQKKEIQKISGSNTPHEQAEKKQVVPADVESVREAAPTPVAAVKDEARPGTKPTAKSAQSEPEDQLREVKTEQALPKERSADPKSSAGKREIPPPQDDASKPVTIASDSTAKDSAIQVKADTIISKTDSMVVAPNAADSSRLPKAPASRSWSIHLLAGLSGSRGFKNTAAADAPLSGSLLIGFGVVKHINDRLSVRTDFILHARGGLASRKTDTETLVGGTITRSTTFTRMQLLQVPFVLQYRFYKSQTVFAGLAANSVLGVQHTTEISVRDAAGFETPYTYTGSGIQKAFTPVDLSIVAGYGVSLPWRMHAGMRLSLGLFDMTRNDYFSNSEADRNIGFQLYLGYDLLRLK